MNQAWIAIGLTIGAYLNWQFVARRLRSYTEVANDSLTLPDFFENRFEDKSRMLRVISAVVILVFFTIYTASGLVGGAKLFESSFDMSYNTALLVGALVIVAYTFLGGFMAVSWTDFFQGILMFCALIIVPVLTVVSIGSWDEAVKQATAIDPSFNDIFSGMSVVGIISLMAWGLGYFGQPHILARFMASKSPAMVPKARLIGMFWMVFGMYGAIFVGFVGVSHFAEAPKSISENVIAKAKGKVEA
jgi:sodium/proline symporter